MKSLILLLLSTLISTLVYGQNSAETKTFNIEMGMASEIDTPPYFPGCDDILDKEEKRKCSERKMSIYVNTRMKYPPQAREKGTSGIVKAQFKINQIGVIENVTILEDIGDGCGLAVKNAILTMGNMDIPWTPGYHHGSVVDVYYTLPVTFNLENGKKRR